MRLTTKIIIGILLSMLLIPLFLIIVFSFTDRKYYSRSYANNIEIPQENQTAIPLDSFQTLVIEEVPAETENALPGYGLSNECYAYFAPISGEHIQDTLNQPDNGSRHLPPASSDKASNTLYVPEALAAFISFQTANDTLRVRLNLPDMVRKHQTKDTHFVSIAGIRLHFDLAKINVINHLQSLPIRLKNIETDSIRVNSSGDIQMDSCKAQVIEPIIRTGYKKLTVKHCEAQKIFLDLDLLQNWNVEHCRIEGEYITGSKKHNIRQHRNETGTINWQPKNKEAQLNVTFQGDTTQIVIR